jgi:NADH-quinone oxidoreductase subunit L
LIPALPLLGAAICAFRPPDRVVRWLAPGAILASFFVSLTAFLELKALPERHVEQIFGVWLPLVHADWGLLLDPLSGVLILIVTGVGFLVHLYATSYMWRVPGYARFFAYMNGFIALMLILLLANNYVLLFAGWEGVGLASYLLIGFEFQRRAAAKAGLKAFVVNRIGDAAFLIGILWYFSVTGSVRFVDVLPPIERTQLAWVAFLFFFGAAGKSAQFPLHVWLPDAMEGPTPVSALIHAATMVTAGVYLIARSSAIFAASTPASALVATIGAFTAIFAAATALVHTDIKRVLAYSTVSQLGFMFLALGVGAWWVAVFHLFTHAFFKALLFLGAGSVIHAFGGQQDMRKMGGLHRKMPLTHWTMFIGAVAISGIPGLAGFFSKDAILNEAFGAGAWSLYLVGVITSGLTAIYMWRLMHLTFYGDGHAATARAHESPGMMTGPLVALAAASAMAGWIGVPRSWNGPEWMHSFEHWLTPVFAGSTRTGNAAPRVEWVLTGISAAVGLIGMAIARYLYYHRPEIPRSLETALKPLHGVLSEEWYLDRVYNFLFVRGLGRSGGRALGRFDQSVIDGGVRGTAWLTRAAGRISGFFDRVGVDGVVRGAGTSVRLLSYPARVLQSGVLTAYAAWIGAGLVALLVWAAIR